MSTCAVLHRASEPFFLHELALRKRHSGEAETGSSRARRRTLDRATLSPFICDHLFPLRSEAVIENTSRMSRKTFLSTDTLWGRHTSIQWHMQELFFFSRGRGKINQSGSQCLRIGDPLGSRQTGYFFFFFTLDSPIGREFSLLVWWEKKTTIFAFISLTQSNEHASPAVTSRKQSELDSSTQRRHSREVQELAAHRLPCVFRLKKGRMVEVWDKDGAVKKKKKPSKLSGSLRTGQATVPEVNRMRRPNNPVKASCTSPPSLEH